MTQETEIEKNVRECLETCLAVAGKDTALGKALINSTHEERVVFLLDNGFEFEGLTEKEAKQLEKQYRKKAAIPYDNII